MQMYFITNANSIHPASRRELYRKLNTQAHSFGIYKVNGAMVLSFCAEYSLYKEIGERYPRLTFTIPLPQDTFTDEYYNRDGD